MINIIKKYWHFLLGIILGLIFINIENIINPILTLFDRFNKGTYFQRFNELNIDYYLQLLDNLEAKFVEFIIYLKDFNVSIFLLDFIKFLLDFLIYGINYGFNFILIIYILFYIFVSADKEEVENTNASIKFIRLLRKMKALKFAIKEKIRHILRFKKQILICFLIITVFNGMMINFIVETMIFIILYFKSSFDLETHLLLFSIIQFAITISIKTFPSYVIVLIFIIWFLYLSYSSGMRRLQKNHDSLKVIAKYEMSFINIITGPPGSGKTRSVVALSLASVENFIDEIEEHLLDIEILNPSINFGEIELDPYQHINYFPEHHYYTQLKNSAKSMIASAPFSILDPYADDYSVILDFDYIRPNSFCDHVPLEEYKILAISELDKEYNSHYNKAEVGEDGLHLFFGTVSHWLKRHGRIYIDYQQPTQVPLNIRGNAETFLKIERTKVKMPFLLNFCSLPFKFLYRVFYKAIDSYSFYKLKITKSSMRTDRRVRKRYDYNLVFSVLRHLSLFLSRVIEWFESFKYTQIYGSVSNVEGETRSKLKLKINSRDEKYKNSYLYDSTFLSKGYENKKRKSLTDWNNSESYKSIHPSDEELKKLHSKFIDKAFFNFEDSKNSSSVESSQDVESVELKFKKG